MLRNKGFTMLEKVSLARPVRKLFSNRAKGRSFLTGFTFIELILVAVIILVLIGVSVPIFRSSSSSAHLKAVSQNLAQLMRYAQAKSIAERKLVRVNFDFEQGAFWLSVQGGAVTDTDTFERIEGRWGTVVEAPEGITISGETPFITFYPDGSSDKTKIKIYNKAGEAFSVTAQRSISYVEVKR